MNKEFVLKKVGKKIREIRLEKGLTQQDVAARIQGSTDATNISRLEAGRSNPTVFMLHRLSLVFEVPMKKLIDVDLSEN